jgi:hypothetical protein
VLMAEGGFSLARPVREHAPFPGGSGAGREWRTAQLSRPIPEAGRCPWPRAFWLHPDPSRTRS